MKVAINGFGRIGRNLFRAALKRNADFEIVAINDITSAEVLAHLLKYDSISGVLGTEVSVTGGNLQVGGKTVRVTSERALPGGAANVALNIQSLGGQAVAAGFVGDDQGRGELMQAIG